jgi:anaerobic magnesium-protoporphyrin IX monomethyl ester cyclase
LYSGLLCLVNKYPHEAEGPRYVIHRVLIVSTSRELSPQPTLPIGAAWVAQALHLAGFEVRLLDLCFERDPFSALDRVLTGFRPDGIGISVRNLDNCDFLSPKSFLPEVKEITDYLQSRTDARLLLGGAGVSVMPEQVLEFLNLDHAVVGEGEMAAIQFFGAGTMKEAAAVPGVFSRGRDQAEDRPSQAPAPAVQPAMHRWIDIARYLRFEPVVPVQGKRGCANSCLYCTYNRIEGCSWRLRDAAAVAEEIYLTKRETGACEFEFVDSVFNEPEGYLETLLEEIVRRDLRVKLRASSLSPKGLTKGQVRLMERAGMTSAVITPESASGVTLAALRKGFTEDDVQHAAEVLGASGIRALWCFLMGGPGEDEATLARTSDFINRRVARKDSSFITTGIRIFPGTGLHQLALQQGSLAPSDTLLMPTFYFSPLISPEQARGVLQKNIADLSRCIFLSDTRKSYLGTWRRLATMLRVPDPFWHYARYMNRISTRSSILNRKWSPVSALKK